MQAITEVVRKVVHGTPRLDIHTHLYPPSFGECLFLYGPDELVTYHYLVAELFRARPDLEPRAFYSLPKNEQANMIWEELFVVREPLSEATRGC